VETLGLALEDPCWLVRRLALRALARLETVSAVEALAHAWGHPLTGDVRGGVARALVVALDSPDSKRKQAAERALRELGPEQTLSLLHTALRSWEPAIQQIVVDQLRQRGDEAAIRILGRLATHWDRHWCAAAMEALGQIGSEEVVKPLVAALWSWNPSARIAAVRALGQVPGGSAVAALARALQHYDREVRHAAARALAEREEAEALVALRGTLGYGDDTLWRIAAEALGRRADEAAIREWMKALKGPDPVAQRTAMWALAAAKSSRPERLLFTETAAEVLEREEISVAALRKAAQGPPWPVCWVALHALGEIGDERALGVLRDRVLWSSPPEIRAAALEALRRLIVRLRERNDPRAIGPLRALLLTDVIFPRDLRDRLRWAIRMLEAGSRHIPSGALSRASATTPPLPSAASLSPAAPPEDGAGEQRPG